MNGNEFALRERTCLHQNEWFAPHSRPLGVGPRSLRESAVCRNQFSLPPRLQVGLLSAFLVAPRTAAAPDVEICESTVLNNSVIEPILRKCEAREKAAIGHLSHAGLTCRWTRYLGVPPGGLPYGLDSDFSPARVLRWTQSGPYHLPGWSASRHRGRSCNPRFTHQRCDPLCFEMSV